MDSKRLLQFQSLMGHILYGLALGAVFQAVVQPSESHQQAASSV